MAIQCIYVEKKPPFAVEAKALLSDLQTVMGMQSVTNVRILNRYLVEHLSAEDFAAARGTIFSEPPVDQTYDRLPDFGSMQVVAVESLPGQFDQRADSCAQCISLATGKERPLVRTAKIYVLEGTLSPDLLDQVKDYLINPVESREASLVLPQTLGVDYHPPTTVEVIQGFVDMEEAGLSALLAELGLAMDIEDLSFCQHYFAATEKRNPTMTEIRMIDTYWSDHCRHTTFLTQIEQVETKHPAIAAAYAAYLSMRKQLGREDKPVTLMDMATIGTRWLKQQGKLTSLDESEEINACSVKIQVDVDGVEQDWLLMFKNETHNHPTEIEPFGGAATCLGGAIRDPLSGRSYVYQAMRVTGASDPLVDPAATIPGKLPQRKIVTTAAAGYAAYGNQIGLATGHVHEIYHPGYVAKHMEVGAVLGAAPAENVVREVPQAGDLVILLGGRTGRDGCGGATGSSKSHTAQSLESCGAEVQKGNPPEERKIQRLFRNPQATRLIRRCNDFGAGGIAVSIGELADGLCIHLDAVPKKYDGLDGTELAISESQERMSVVVRAEDAEKMIALAAEENLEATVVAEITEEPRLRMEWCGNTIVDLSRAFLNSNGAPKKTNITMESPPSFVRQDAAITQTSLLDLMGSLGYCSQKGLIERFDSTIGAATVLMPFGGMYQMTPTQTMVAKIPVKDGETNTCSLMAWGYDAEITDRSPYHGGHISVIASIAKLIAAGGSRHQCWLSFQEYFPRLGSDPVRWGKPAAALLGALEAQVGLQCAAIGGKDSMSGSFEEIDVPATLISFAVSVADVHNILSPEFKRVGSKVYLLRAPHANALYPPYTDLCKLFDQVEALIASGQIHSAWAVGAGGTAEAVAKMCFGNRIGFAAEQALDICPQYGAFLVEADDLPEWHTCQIGTTIAPYVLQLPTKEQIDLANVQHVWENKLTSVYPISVPQTGEIPDLPAANCPPKQRRTSLQTFAQPRVVIPVFPGTNCEEDTARAFRRAGAQADIVVIRNQSASDIAQSVQALAEKIQGAQIVAIPGGFSGGDEPDGSAKFIASFFRNARIAEEVAALLENRDGLMCGICNGFQALIKLGLLPFGQYMPMKEDAPTLTYNTIGRHQSMMVHTKILSNRSPWLCGFHEGDVFTIPVSHGEGRFIADDQMVEQLLQNGQIATVYVDHDGHPTLDIRFNPNHSVCAIEGITSPDGRIFGKMGHNERYGEGLYRNIHGNTTMDMFQNAVHYYGL